MGEAGGGATRHTRAWSVGEPTVVADFRWLRSEPFNLVSRRYSAILLLSRLVTASAKTDVLAMAYADQAYGVRIPHKQRLRRVLMLNDLTSESDRWAVRGGISTVDALLRSRSQRRAPTGTTPACRRGQYRWASDPT
jgi:hypothetical protein